MKNNRKLPRHNKKRNSALIYEFLIRHISKCLIEGRKEEANKAMNLSAKYFSKGSPLQNELSLFSTILKANVKSKDSAQKILDVVCRTAENMNARVLDEYKSKLIKDINYTFKNPNFYDVKVPNYTVYSSLQTLMNESRNKKKTLNIIDKVKFEDNITDYLMRESKIVDDPLKSNPDYSNAVYKFLTQKFHKKYEGKLTESQKRLLTQYSVFLISNKPNALKEVISKEIGKIKTSLTLIKDESIRKDGDLMKKLHECRKSFDNFSCDEVTESKILEILQYIKLVDELES